MRIVSDGTSIGTKFYDDNGVKLDPMNPAVMKIEWELTAPDDAKVVLHIYEDRDSTDTIRYFPIGKVSVDLKVKPENVEINHE